MCRQDRFTSKPRAMQVPLCVLPPTAGEVSKETDGAVCRKHPLYQDFAAGTIDDIGFRLLTM